MLPQLFISVVGVCGGLQTAPVRHLWLNDTGYDSHIGQSRSFYLCFPVSLCEAGRHPGRGRISCVASRVCPKQGLDTYHSLHTRTKVAIYSSENIEVRALVCVFVWAECKWENLHCGSLSPAVWSHGGKKRLRSPFVFASGEDLAQCTNKSVLSLFKLIMHNKKMCVCVCYRSSHRGVCEPADASASLLPAARQRPRDEDEHIYNAC